MKQTFILNGIDILQQVDELKSENEKLKREIKLIEKNADMYADLFNDDYFKGLTPEQVIELAKKSIRITSYNRELENTLEEIREIAKFNQFYNPEDLLIKGDMGQIQDLKMTEVYNKINEVLK